MAIEMQCGDYRGWPNTYRLTNGVVEAHVLSDVGPRIIDFRLVDHDNILYVRDSEAGRYGEPEFVQRGGWRLWVAPERRETTYAADNSRCHTVTMGDTLRVTGAVQPAAGIQKELDVSVDPTTATLRIIARVYNRSDRVLTYAPWSLPVLRPRGRAFIPLDRGAVDAFDATRRYILWSYTRIADPRYRFGDQLIEIDHATVRAGAPGLGRRSDESKIGCDSSQGWAAYLVDSQLFVKRFRHVAAGHYVDGGSTIEVYSSAEFLELEHLGPLTSIAPGEHTELEEEWCLYPDVVIPREESGALDALRPYAFASGQASSAA